MEMFACGVDAPQQSPADLDAQSLCASAMSDPDPSPETAGVLLAVNSTSAASLEQDAKLAPELVQSIERHRVGPDGIFGTEDDDLFESFDQLANIGGFDEQACVKLVALAKQEGTLSEEETTSSALSAAPANGTLELDCTDLTPAARNYAVQHGYCPGSTSSGGTVTQAPQGTVVGNCGSSYLNMGDVLRNHGQTRFQFGGHSTRGSIVAAHYRIPWLNYDHLNRGALTGTHFQFNASWDQIRYANTRNGLVCGNLFGYVILWWGGRCNLGGAGSCGEIR
jgi:hypothetical protein